MTEAEDRSIPTRTELDEAISRSVSKNTFRTYYRPVFDFLYNDTSPNELITTDQIYSQISKDVNRSTKWKHIGRVLEYDPSLIERIVDKTPPTDVFVIRAANRLDIGRSEISGKNLNLVQKECIELGDDIYEQYLDYHLQRIRKEAETKAGIDLYRRESIPVEKYEQVLDAFGDLIGEELPKELNSFNQGMVSIAGEANELIAIETLRFQGLREGSDFEHVGGNRKEDIIIYTNTDGPQLNVEVKSTGIRERSEGGLSRLPDPTILFAFFDDATEVISRIDDLVNTCLVAYVPPNTLEEVREKDREAYNQRSKNRDIRFLRANNTFPEDMAHYVDHGEVPDHSKGHERWHR